MSPITVDPRTGRKMPCCYIHRGLPGSGKTTHANEHGCLVISPYDMYSYRCGQYQYDHKYREEARRWGYSLFGSALFERVDVAIAEVLPTHRSMREYIERAEREGYHVIVYDHIIDVETSFKRNKHKVPLEVIESMAAAFQPWPGAVEVQVRKDTPMADLKLYSIEGASIAGSIKHRFRSNFNSCVGAWCRTKEEAIQDGKNHQAILQQLYRL